MIKTPIAAPLANSHMERQTSSSRRECLDWLVILGRRHAESVLTEWFEHHNRARPHRALELRTPIARSDPVLTVGPIVCRKRLGGLLTNIHANLSRPQLELTGATSCQPGRRQS